jgi:hypothetical protein
LRADVHGERVRGAGTARDELVLGAAVVPVIVLSSAFRQPVLADSSR